MINKAPAKEQQICLNCGFCCDGTLFLHARLNPGERGNLPVKIEENSYSEGENEYFRLPCSYFSGKCTIYDQKRADVCSAYRCQLLKDSAEGKVTMEEAQEIVRDAVRMRNTLFDEYGLISGSDTGITFRQMLTELVRSQESIGIESKVKEDLNILLARCNILEALLIKRIRSASDFDSMVINSPGKPDRKL